MTERDIKKLIIFLNAVLLNHLVGLRLRQGNISNRERRFMRRALNRSKAELKALRRS